MTNATLPPHLALIDEATLTPLVQRALARPTAVVLTWTCETLHGGLGTGTAVYRFAGQAHIQAELVPWSLILKVLWADPRRADPAHPEWWCREAEAYRSNTLESLPSGFSAPRCFAVIERAGEGYWLWLEEITAISKREGEQGMSEVNRVWRLRKRPTGVITDDVLRLEEEALPEPSEGEFLFRLNYLSLDPTNRLWMSDVDQYMPPVDLDAPMRGIVCGTVTQSRHPDYAEGTIVSGLGTWADYQIGTPQTVQPMGDTGPFAVVDAFSTFALVGPTAYFGLLDIGKPQAGETVVVSAAAGAVGSIVGQIAKIKGCRVVGIAGTDEKCAWIRDELGFDAAINYRTEEVPSALAAACPAGIDVYFDNVGGAILDACLPLMNLNGRIAFCGLISQINTAEPIPGPYNYPMILMKRLRVEGFIILDFMHRYPEAIAALGQWLAEGKIQVRTEIVDGLENALQALKKLYTGANTGKLMIRVKDV